MLVRCFLTRRVSLTWLHCVAGGSVALLFAHQGVARVHSTVRSVSAAAAWAESRSLAYCPGGSLHSRIRPLMQNQSPGEGTSPASCSSLGRREETLVSGRVYE